MKYIVITDYPYFTTKKFFEDVQEAVDYIPDINKLLNSRIYTLTSYSETLNKDNEVHVNYGVDATTRINKTI